MHVLISYEVVFALESGRKKGWGCLLFSFPAVEAAFMGLLGSDQVSNPAPDKWDGLTVSTRIHDPHYSSPTSFYKVL